MERSISSVFASVHQACSYWKASQVCGSALINEEDKHRQLHVVKRPCGAKRLHEDIKLRKIDIIGGVSEADKTLSL